MKSSPDWKKFLLDDHAEIKRLNYVTRYSSIPSLYRESVSEHSYWVTLYSLLLHRQVTKAAGVDSAADVEYRILKKALVHDIVESVTGDLVRTFKYSSTSLKQSVDEAEGLMVEKYMPGHIKNLIIESNNDESQDAKYMDAIVKAADFVSLFHYMHREYNRGNREIMPFLNRMKTDMKDMASRTKSGEWYQKMLSGLYESMSKLVMCPEEDRPV
jgi:5'-deoxynucleotidase YfbR-like HD superfamily hydrolase